MKENKMNKTLISIHYLNGIVVEQDSYDHHIQTVSLTAEIMKLGFSFSQELFNVIKTNSESSLKDIYLDLIPELRNIKGADVIHTPFYKNFPQEVMNKSSVGLYFDALKHLWSGFTWTPDKKIERQYQYEHTTFSELKLLSEKQFQSIFTSLLNSNESITPQDVKTIEWFLTEYDKTDELVYPKEIPFKENLCLISHEWLAGGFALEDISKLISNSTDILRIYTRMSGGDISLAKKTKYIPFKRTMRKKILHLLEKVIREEDIRRHVGKWIKVFHMLHVGDYKNEFPKSFAIASIIRNNEVIRTFNTRIEEYIKSGKIKEAADLLVSRPGDFARRLDKLIRLVEYRTCSCSIDYLLEKFEKIVDKLPNRLKFQLYGHFKRRNNELKQRIAFKKGSVSNPIVIKQHLEPLSVDTVSKILNVLKNSFVRSFSKLPSLGKCYIDETLKEAPIPFNNRSNSGSFKTLTRGTRVPIELKKTIRLFIYWIGEDLDLSAALFNEHFQFVDSINFSNMKKSFGVHSGDIRSAPKGASEFIDLDTEILKHMNNVRYITADIRVYSGKSFDKLKKCFIGYMQREYPKSNEIFDPKTVEYKIDVVHPGITNVPVIFDLKEDKMIWFDTTLPSIKKVNSIGTAAASAQLSDVIKNLLSIDNKSSLYDLFSFHAEARGSKTDSVDEADTIFSWTGDVTPYDITKIISEYL